MRRLFLMAVLMMSLALAACSTGYQAYRAGTFRGKALLGEEEYAQAKEEFVKASQAGPQEPEAYALAATASYKMHDVAAADRLIQEAMKHDKQSDVYIRILGYRALILFKQGKENEAFDVLHDYIAAYQNAYSLASVKGVSSMWRKKQVDINSLEKLLDEGITTYENDIEQYRRSGTGWFAQKYVPTPSPGR